MPLPVARRPPRSRGRQGEQRLAGLTADPDQTVLRAAHRPPPRQSEDQLVLLVVVLVRRRLGGRRGTPGAVRPRPLGGGQLVEDHVEYAHRAGLVQRLVAVAALGRLHAGRAAALALAG